MQLHLFSFDIERFHHYYYLLFFWTRRQSPDTNLPLSPDSFLYLLFQCCQATHRRCAGRPPGMLPSNGLRTVAMPRVIIALYQFRRLAILGGSCHLLDNSSTPSLCTGQLIHLHTRNITEILTPINLPLFQAIFRPTRQDVAHIHIHIQFPTGIPLHNHTNHPLTSHLSVSTSTIVFFYPMFDHLR